MCPDPVWEGSDPEPGRPLCWLPPQRTLGPALEAPSAGSCECCGWTPRGEDVPVSLPSVTRMALHQSRGSEFSGAIITLSPAERVGFCPLREETRLGAREGLGQGLPFHSPPPRHNLS